MRRQAVIVAVLLAFAGGVARAETIVVEFGEVDLPNLSVLDGTGAFAAFHLDFASETVYVIDNLLLDVGTDNRGISTTGTADNVADVLFTTPATELTFFYGALGSSTFNAQVLDAGGNLLDSVSIPGTGFHFGSHSFSGVGPISRLRFFDGTGLVAIGRLEYNLIPEPATWALMGLGLPIVVIAGRVAARKAGKAPEAA